MRSSNMSLANALKALEEEQQIDVAKLEGLRDSLIDGKAAILEGRDQDRQSIERLCAETISRNDHRCNTIADDFQQKIDAINAHIAAIRAEPAQTGEQKVVKLQQQAAE